MLEHYLNLGGVEIANHARLRAYLESVGSPLSAPTVCACDTFDGDLLGEEPYTDPATDEAPWYDPDIPESAQFAGLMVLSVDGMDYNPVTRTASTAVTGGAAFGGRRVQPLTITITGVLLGATCCGVDYGLAWLREALAGCGGGCGGGGCGGDCLTYFQCCPSDDTTDEEEFRARYARTIRRVALTSGPTPTARAGSGCSVGECSTGADMVTVEIVLTAGTPWAWTAPVPLLDVAAPGDDGECVVWCVHDRNAPPPTPPVCLDLDDAGPCAAGAVVVPFDGTCESDVSWPDSDDAEHPCATCRLAPCPDPNDMCTDPGCSIPDPPVAPPPATCFARALAVNSEAYELDLSGWPRYFGAVPLLEVYAGARDLRRLTVTLFERRTPHSGLTCDEVAVMERCNPAATFEVGFVPAGGVVLLDGQIGRGFVTCRGRCAPSPDVYGRDGGPLTFPLLTCDRYCVLIEQDAISPAADDARVVLSLSGRGYSARS